INKDLDGKVETSKYNTLVSTVDSTIRRIGDAEGNITQVEQSVNGLRTTVANKVNQSEVTQLANGFNVLVKDFEDMEIGGRNLAIGTSSQYKNETVLTWQKPITKRVN